VGGFFKHIVKKTLGIDKDSDYQRDKTQAEKEDERRLANARNLGQARRQGAVLKTKEYDYKQAQDSSLQEEFNKLNGAGVKGTPKLLFPTEPAKVNSPFGTRTDPFGSGAKQAHKGIDIKVPAGTPVYAAADGRVVLAQILKGYGLVIYLQHDDGTSTRYAHLSGLMPNIKVGAVVRAGQQIAYSGGIKGLPTSGRSEGPHLHFEYRDANAGATSNDAKPLNPIAYFKGLDKGNVDMVVEAGEPEKPKDDMGSKPIIPTPPKATSGQIAAIKTTPPGTQPVPSVKGEIATTSGNPVVAGTTNVNVAPPNLDPLNKTIVDTSKGCCGIGRWW
jgi:murein DD-endopeptidase MepM/ murein hydrolase activator NlpD